MITSRRIGAGLKCRVNRREHDRRQQQPDAVGDVSHDDEQARREDLHLAAEPLAEELVDRLQLAPEIHRDKDQRDDDSAEHVAEHELQELKIAALREGEPGTEMNVIVLVSVATIDIAIAHHGTFRSPTK